MMVLGSDNTIRGSLFPRIQQTFSELPQKLQFVCCAVDPPTRSAPALPSPQEAINYIALNLKEIPYDIKPISLIKAGGEQHCNEFREINPMEQVPALYIDGHTLVESLNIMHYLEETRPQRPLMPQDVIKRAKVREICEVIASGIQPLQNLIVLIYVGEEKKKEWAQHWINRGFHAVEKLLSTSAGKYCVGDEISIADCCLIPQVFNARRFHVDLRPFPTILRIDRELENHPAFRAAHPSNQPDCPPEATK